MKVSIEEAVDLIESCISHSMEMEPGELPQDERFISVSYEGSRSEGQTMVLRFGMWDTDLDENRLEHEDGSYKPDKAFEVTMQLSVAEVPE